MSSLLRVNVSVHYPGRPKTLDQLHLEVGSGEIVGLAGQSGSGKSTLALAVMRLLPRNAKIEGSIEFDGQDLLQHSESQMRAIRGRRISLALQAAASALNPHLRIETQMKEAWRAHDAGPWTAGRRRTLDMLAAMDLTCDEAFLRRYPRQVSIGQAQRIVLAMALLHQPDLLIADEPTSALDMMAQVELLQLLKKINREQGTSILYISHDLGTVKHLCHRICVLDGGELVESGTPEQIFARPSAVFTQSLIAAHRQLYSSAEIHYPEKNLPTPQQSLQT